MDRILGGAVVGDHRVARLMEGGQLLFLIGDDMAAFFRAHHHLDGGFLDLRHGDGVQTAAGGKQRRLIEQVFPDRRR